MPVRARRLHRRCRRLLASVPLPDPFSLPKLIQNLSHQRGRPLRVLPFPTEPASGGPYGLWIATDTDDVILYEKNTSLLHQEHIILHEVGHIVTSTDAHVLCANSPTDLEARPEFFRFIRHLDPTIIQRIYTRDFGASEHERQAEIMASLIQVTARRSLRPCTSGIPDGLETTLGFRRG